MSKKIILVVSLAVVVAATVAFLLQAPPAGSKGQVYGKPLDPQAAPAVALPALFARTGEYMEKRVIVEGRIGQVCQTSGCWITLTDGPNQLLVQFYDFTVHLTPGTPVRVSGQVRVRNSAPYIAASGLEVLD